MSLSYNALGDKLSNTDPISNAVLISGLDFARDAAKLLRAGHYPISCLNSYIHESLHHTCFRSPVGTAIAFLYNRGFLRAYDHIRLGEASEFDALHVLDDIARIEAILHIMRPLAEGVALFGEFDAYPGNSRSLSSVFRLAAVTFADVVPNWETMKVENVLRSVLNRGRARLATQRRKENLLMQGFSTLNGGYLPGYFLIKNLQFALVSKLQCDRLLDSEFYLNFIAHWFYNDFELVATLIDGTKELCPSNVEQDAVNSISIAFQRRMSMLFTYLTADMVDQFDDLLASGKIPWCELQLGMDRQQAKRVQERLVAEINEVIDFAGAPSDQRIVRELCHDITMRRNYLCLGSFLEDIEISSNGHLRISRLSQNSPFPVMMLGKSEKPGPWKGKATLDILQSGRSGRVFLTVYANHELVFIEGLGEGFGEERSEIINNNLSTSFCRVVKQHMRETIDKALDTGSAAGFLRDHYRTEWELSTSTMYRNWCGALMALNGPEASLSEAPGGFLSMCERDTKFLRTIAGLGCIGRRLLDEDDLTRACAAQGIVVEQFKARLNAVERDYGFRFLYPLERFFVLTI